MNCDHTSKIIKWGLDESHRFVATLYGCTDCEWNSPSPWISHPDDDDIHEHPEYVEGCFACKIQTLQLSTGDANGGLIANGWTNKKWEGELQAYRDARRQGIQPASTKTRDIRKALDMSDKAGKAVVVQ